MLWWTWLIPALFMLAMIVIGLIYAVLYGICVLRDMSDIGGQLGECATVTGESDTSADISEPPLFIQPFSAVQNRYIEAHVDVIRSKAAKRERHTQAWARWKRFNN